MIVLAWAICGAIGLICAFVVGNGLRTGEMPDRGGRVRRSKEAGGFWFNVFFLFTLSVFSFGAFIALLAQFISNTLFN